MIYVIGQNTELVNKIRESVDLLNYLDQISVEQLDINNVQRIKNAILVIPLSLLEKIDTSIWTKHLVIFFKDVEKWQTTLVLNESVCGVISGEEEISTLVGIFRMTLKYEKLRTLEQDMLKLSMELSALNNISESELKRIKKLHEHIVPQRFFKERGLKVIGKYKAGISPGGEYFDFFKKGNSFFIFLTSLGSYVLTSRMLGHFEKFQAQPRIDQNSVEDFLSSTVTTLKSNEECGQEISLTLLSFDFSTFELSCYNFGSGQIVHNSKLYDGNQYPVDKAFIDKAHFKMKLDRKDRIHIISKGFLLSSKRRVNNKSPHSFLFDYSKNHECIEVLNEAFYHVASIVKDEFFPFDSTLITLEVESNAIIQI